MNIASPRLAFIALALLCATLLAPGISRAQSPEDLTAKEEAAFKAAVERVAPSVVTIETVGGMETASGVLFGTGPTTGLVVGEDGYLVSSAFNFAQHPTSILVTLPGGKRVPAKLVATDRQRMIVLLKVESPDKLPVPEATPAADIKVGQWSVAVGRTYEAGQTNLSVGIVSARDRIWGKAIQTDAKISPANYGGPLVDLEGRVLGVLVPLSPDHATELAGMEWYDSGIGFAVPLEQIQTALPRLKKGEDLQPGLAGIGLKAGDPYGGAPEVATALPNSPAAKAGIKPGDKIVGIAGKTIRRATDLRRELGQRYAGDVVHVAVLRDGKTIELDVPLVAKIDPYARPFLGLLAQDGADDRGIEVRFVFPDSPAAAAGIEPGDALRIINGTAVKTRDELITALQTITMADTVKLGIRHGDADATKDLKPAPVSEKLPDALPPRKLLGAAKPAGAIGEIKVQVAEFKNECPAYVPKLEGRGQYGLLVWAPPTPTADAKQSLAAWKSVCDKYGLIVLVPQPADERGWRPQELELVRKAIEQVRSDYPVDPLRVAVGGEAAGGRVAALLAGKQRELVHGLVALGEIPLAGIAPNEPSYRLALLAFGSIGGDEDKLDDAVAKLREAKYPVTTIEAGAKPTLDDTRRESIGRWVDSLDRL